MKALSPLLLVAGLVAPAFAQTVVTTTADSGGGSLRQAILDTNANGGAETITFDSSLDGQTIRLTSGELEITDDLTIDGSNLTNPITISGDADDSGTPTAADSRIFRAASPSTVVLDSLIITGGKAPDGTENKGESGGAIHSGAYLLEIRNCWVHGNAAGNGNDGHSQGSGGDGGGIFSAARTLRILNSTISNNRTGIEGNNAGGSFVGGNGGGVSFLGVLIVENSTISGNIARSLGAGGGIYFRGSRDSLGVLYLDSSTVSDNQAEQYGGGIYGLFMHLHIKSSIVAGNSTIIPNLGASADLRLPQANSTVNGYGSNLIGDNGELGFAFPTPSFEGQANFFGDFVGTPNSPLDPGLSSLSHNGGIGPTHLLLPDSPAINPSTADATARFTTDQRGSIRILGGLLDIGAVEGANPNVLVTDPNNAVEAALKKKLSALKRGLERKLKIAKRKKKRAKIRRLKARIHNLKIRLSRL